MLPWRHCTDVLVKPHSCMSVPQSFLRTSSQQQTCLVPNHWCKSLHLIVNYIWCLHHHGYDSSVIFSNCIDLVPSIPPATVISAWYSFLFALKSNLGTIFNFVGPPLVTCSHLFIEIINNPFSHWKISELDGFPHNCSSCCYFKPMLFNDFAHFKGLDSTVVTSSIHFPEWWLSPFLLAHLKDVCFSTFALGLGYVAPTTAAVICYEQGRSLFEGGGWMVQPKMATC